MSNQEHVDRLLQGVEAWNQWRQENPAIHPELSSAYLNNAILNGADLGGADLHSAYLSNTILSSVNLSDADLSDAILNGAILSGATLSNANLSDAYLSGADLRNANLRDAYLSGIGLRDACLSGADLRNANLSNAILSGAGLSRANLSSVIFSGANLSYADLSNAYLSGAIFTAAKLIATNFSGANLSNANLTAVQALQANFQAARLTGACIKDWNINSDTNLQGVICEYIFVKYDDVKYQFTDRRPHNPNQIFAPGEFTKRYQIVLETVDLFFNDGIDWKAFLDSLEDLKAQYGDDLNLQGIEKKAGGSFVVRLEVPSDVDKGTIERTAKELYETKLEILEARYHAELQAKDKEIESYRRESANMMEIAKLLANKPITVEAKAVAENQSSSESYTNTFTNSPIANFANKMQDQASMQTNQYIGANLHEISLIQSLRSRAESFPQEKRAETLEYLDDLEKDVQQPPEKRKVRRIQMTLAALVAIATTVSGAVTSTNEFVGQVQELSEKLGIELPIAQPQSQNAIDVEAIDSAQQ